MRTCLGQKYLERDFPNMIEDSIGTMSEQQAFDRARAYEYTFKLPPEPVGWWILPGSVEECKIKFSCMKKPNMLHRMTMKYLLGWEYEHG